MTIPPDWIAAAILIGTPTFGLWAIGKFIANEPWFQALSAVWKSRAVLIILLVLFVLSTLAVAPVKGWDTHDLQTWYPGLAMMLVGWLTSEWFAEAGRLYRAAKNYLYWRFAVKVIPTTNGTGVKQTTITTDQPPLKEIGRAHV